MSGGTMRITGAGCVIIGPEGRTPPLPFVTVPEGEGESFIALKLATLYTGEEPEADAEAEAAAAEAEAKAKAEAEAAAEAEAKAAEEAAAAEAEAKAKAEAEAAANANPEGGNTNPEGGDERATTIADALDLVEDAGLVKSGDRKGKPTVKAIEDITGLTDVTADEIDAAIAAKDSAE